MPLITEISNIIEYKASPFNLDDQQEYLAWRDQKLENYPEDSSKLVVEISDFENLSAQEFEAMCSILTKSNMVIYSCDAILTDSSAIKKALKVLSSRFGLDADEAHRSAGEESIVALEVTNQGGKRGYIPYSDKRLNWHTDGYYNATGKKIGAFLLHCARDALTGGQNQLLDPEIAYIRLRDENPAYIIALSHQEAMTIPFNTEQDGSTRPDSVGPVFMVSDDGTALSMRYTARTRSILWRDDPVTTQAVAFLKHLLDGNEPLVQTVKLRPGEGIINNNVLHNRAGFENNGKENPGRLLYRIRFHQRIKLLRQIPTDPEKS